MIPGLYYIPMNLRLNCSSIGNKEHGQEQAKQTLYVAWKNIDWMVNATKYFRLC